VRTLRTRLTAGLVLLLAIACLAIGAATSLLLHQFLLTRLDQQLTTAAGFPVSLEHDAEPSEDNHWADTRGQAPGTFGARLLNSRVTQSGLVRANSDDTTVTLAARDRQKLAALPVDGRGHNVRLSALDDYRLMATRGKDHDVLITGLPLEATEETVERLIVVETLVFGGVLFTTGLAGAGLVRLSLRPLRRMAATAATVVAQPLASGAVDLRQRVPDVDQRTEIGQVGAALNQMLEHIEDALEKRHASEERLRQFSADASHELRTPVAAVRGHADIALRTPEPIPPEVRHSLRRIEAEAIRMGDLVDELLLLARLDSGRPLVSEPVDVTRLALDGTSDARALGPEHRWALELPTEPVMVQGDAHRLHQVVTNLLTNARLHTPAGTTVTVRLTTEETSAALEVKDDGPGIPGELQEKIFERFIRADKARARSHGGTGLGLAIVEAVVHAHHGRLTLDSRPGRTVFRVELPLAPASADVQDGGRDG
jgi:two-component system OmpR family sensor kinase